MKQVMSVVLLIGLLAIPIGCILAVCPAVDHDCCPKSDSAISGCPYDILSLAKTAVNSIAIVVSAAVLPIPAAPMIYHPAFQIVALVPDTRDLNILNRVLLI
jgi:hypothetical protein